jgi:hypothetical protein
VSPFKGDKKKVSVISNVDTKLKVINPETSDISYKPVLIRIRGEPRVAITHELSKPGKLKGSF